MSSQVKPWLVLAVIFIVGVVTGSALTIGWTSHFQRPQGPPQIRRLWMAHLVTRLDLTPDQPAKIQPILAEAEGKIQALHRDEVEHGAQIIKTTDDQIAALLTPEQQTELQKMESEREKMFSGHMRPWGSPHDGPGGMFQHGGPDEQLPAPPLPPPGASTNAPPSPAQ